MHIKLDLAKFKKVSSDKKITTLRDPDTGHEVRIAHSSLHPKMREKISKLPLVVSHHGDEKNVKLEESAKEPKKMADGGMVTDDDKKKTLGSIIGFPGSDPKPKKMADGGEVAASDPVLDMSPGMAMPIASSPEAIQATPPPAALAMSPPQMSPESMTPPPAAQMAPPIPDAAAPVPQANPLVDPTASMGHSTGPTPTILGGFDKQRAGIAQEAAATAQQAKDQTQTLLADEATKMKLSSDYNAHYKALDDERAHLQKDVSDGHIDPQHFWADKSTSDKMSTAIGLILGGLGSGITGGPNQALEFLNKNIDRDIDAQKMELGKKENLLSANMKQFGNLKDATDMTRLMQMDQLNTKLKLAAAKAQGPMAKAEAMKQAGALEAQMAPIQQNLAIRQMIAKSGSDGNDPGKMLQVLRVTNPEAAKEMEDRYVPSVGVASVPVPADVRGQLVAQTNLIKATGALRDWAKQNGATLDPVKRAEGQALAAELQQIYRKGVGASTSEGEQKIIESVISANPGQLLSKFLVDPKLQALEHSMGRSLNTLKQQYGLPQQAEAAQNRGASGPQVRELGGVKYQKVDGGWKRLK